MSASDATDHGATPLEALDQALTHTFTNGDVEMTNGSHGGDTTAPASLEPPASAPISAPQAATETTSLDNVPDTTITTASTVFLSGSLPASTTAPPPTPLSSTNAPLPTPHPSTQPTLDPLTPHHPPPLLNQNHNSTAPSVPTPPARASPVPATTASPARASTPLPGAANNLHPSAIMPPANPHGSATRVYVNTKVTPVLLEGMKWVARNEPEKPLKWLGEYLLKRSADVEGT